MKPTLNLGDYIFCTTKDAKNIDLVDIVLFFKEEEWYTFVLEQGVADKMQLEYFFVSSWITLTVHSSLEAVGLTAAFANALADKNISCNVVAGYFHDHIFVDKKDTQTAMQVLDKFSQI